MTCSAGTMWHSRAAVLSQPPAVALQPSPFQAAVCLVGLCCPHPTSVFAMFMCMQLQIASLGIAIALMLQL